MEGDFSDNVENQGKGEKKTKKSKYHKMVPALSIRLFADVNRTMILLD